MEAKRNEVAEQIRQNAEQTEQALRHCFPGKEDPALALIFEAEQYSLLGGGKRIRPLLVNSFCRMFGGETEVSMPYACALEMIHTYSLIHDDLPCMDDDDLRRGKPTCHKKFDEATAVLAGDALLTRAFLTAAENPHADGATNAEAVKLLAGAAGDCGMIGGQIMDLEGEKRRLELPELLRLHSLKTGALIECAALLGCLAAGCVPGSTQTLAAGEYARKTGLCFQIIDDILDISGVAQELGKNSGSDANHNKTTFMTYYSIEDARRYAEEYTSEAISALSGFAHSEFLTDLAVYLLNRSY